MRNCDVLKILRKWLKVNNPSYLAWKLGYRSTNTIENWISRNSIPSRMVPHVMRVLNDE